MKTLTVKAPWVWCIFHASKNIENRTWKTDYRGPLLIHMGKNCTSPEWIAARELCRYNHAHSSSVPVSQVLHPNIQEWMMGLPLDSTALHDSDGGVLTLTDILLSLQDNLKIGLKD